MIYDTKQICRKLLNLAKVEKEWRDRWRERKVVVVFTRQQWFSNNFFCFFLSQKKHIRNQMRHEMVSQKEGEMEFSLLTHSDDMKRVSTRTQRFVDILTHTHILTTSTTNQFCAVPLCLPACVIGCLFFFCGDFSRKKLKTNVILPVPTDIFTVRLMELPSHWPLHCPTSMECMN